MLASIDRTRAPAAAKPSHRSVNHETNRIAADDTGAAACKDYGIGGKRMSNLPEKVNWRDAMSPVDRPAKMQRLTEFNTTSTVENLRALS